MLSLRLASLSNFDCPNRHGYSQRYLDLVGTPWLPLVNVPPAPIFKLDQSKQPLK